MAETNHWHHGTERTSQGNVTGLLNCYHPLSGDPEKCPQAWQDVDISSPTNPGRVTRQRLPVITVEATFQRESCTICDYLMARAA